MKILRRITYQRKIVWRKKRKNLGGQEKNPCPKKVRVLTQSSLEGRSLGEKKEGQHPAGGGGSSIVMMKAEELLGTTPDHGLKDPLKREKEKPQIKEGINAQRGVLLQKEGLQEVGRLCREKSFIEKTTKKGEKHGADCQGLWS